MTSNGAEVISTQKQLRPGRGGCRRSLFVVIWSCGIFFIVRESKILFAMNTFELRLSSWGKESEERKERAKREGKMRSRESVGKCHRSSRHMICKWNLLLLFPLFSSFFFWTLIESFLARCCLGSRWAGWAPYNKEEKKEGKQGRETEEGWVKRVSEKERERERIWTLDSCFAHATVVCVCRSSHDIHPAVHREQSE